MCDTLTISIIKEEHNIGNILYSKGRYNLLTALQKTIDIINNYNRELLGAGLPEEMLTLRMLQEENRWGTKNRVRARVLEDSDKYLRSKYKTYFKREGIFNTSDHYGKIAISQKNIYENLDNADLHVRISIDELKVEFYRCITVYSHKEAKKKFGIDIQDLSGLKKDISRMLVTAPAAETTFNALSDFYDFVSKNQNGWKIEDDDYYFISPII